MRNFERNVTWEAAVNFVTTFLGFSIYDLNWVHRPERSDTLYDGWSVVVWGKRGKGTSVVIKDTTVDTGTITLNVTNGYLVL